MRKVSERCHDLAAQGLLGSDEACRVALMGSLLEMSGGSGEAVTLSRLAECAGVAMMEVDKHIQHLAALSVIERSGGQAYRLSPTFDRLVLPESVLPLLLQRTEGTSQLSIGLPYRYQAHCASTSAVLRRDASRWPAGTLMVTDDQTQGRGRLGRTWSSRPGEDLTFSVLLRPKLVPAQAPLLSLGAALAVAEVLESLPRLTGRVWIKWPNDILVDDKKICGILLESSVTDKELDWVVAGIGLNVNSDPKVICEVLSRADDIGSRERPRPTSLREELGMESARGALLAELLVRLAFRWQETPTGDLLDSVRTRDMLRGRRLHVYAGPPDGTLLVSGKAHGIGPQGELLVEQPAGRVVPVVAGEVTLGVDSSA